MKTYHAIQGPRKQRGSVILTVLTVCLLAGGNAIAADGAAVYAKKCKSCHGADGSANTKMGKKLKCRDLSKASVQAKLTDAQIAKSITHGVSEGGKVRMKPITGVSEADIKAVVKYVRTLKK